MSLINLTPGVSRAYTAVTQRQGVSVIEGIHKFRTNDGPYIPQPVADVELDARSSLCSSPTIRWAATCIILCCRVPL